MLAKPGYVPPRVVTLDARHIVEALGPVSAGSGTGGGCTPTGWMGGCPVG